MAFYVARQPVELIFAWLAISGAACLLERTGQEPVVIQPISDLQNGEVLNELLRPETTSTQERGSAKDR